MKNFALSSTSYLGLCNNAVLAERLAAEGVGLTAIDGGMFVFAALPDGLKAATLFDAAVQRDVLVASGPAFACPPSDGRFASDLRLCFARLTENAIATATDRLIAAMRDGR